jgi:hypothetical protein
MSNTQNNDYNAARAYLQRSEVRLSTMHRIAGAFIGGAGLLILTPFFLKDITVNLVNYLGLLKKSLNVDFIQSISFSSKLNFEYIGIIISFGLPVGISVFLAIKTIADLYREILRFYYIPNLLNWNVPANSNSENSPFLPRFSLTGIRMSQDEVNLIHNFESQLKESHEILERQSFVIPQLPNSEYQKHLRNLIITSNGELIGETITSEDKILDGSEEREINSNDIYKAGFSLANMQERMLLAREVAKMEASLVRHNLFLRRLVFRYVKSVLVLLVIGICLVLASSIISYSVNSESSFNESKRLITSVLVSGTLILQFVFVYWAVLRPAKWIKSTHLFKFESLSESDEPKLQQPILHYDEQLTEFEKSVEGFSLLGIFFTLLGISLYGYKPEPLVNVFPILNQFSSYWFWCWIGISFLLFLFYMFFIAGFAFIKTKSQFTKLSYFWQEFTYLLWVGLKLPTFLFFIFLEGSR